MNKKVLITGATGLLGSNLVRTLKEKYCVDVFEGDIFSLDNVEACYKKSSSYAWVIHTAAMTNVELCERDRKSCFNINVEGTKNIRNFAERCGAKFLYISTVSVFSGVEGSYVESDIPYPKNYYNLSKYLGEQSTLEYSEGFVLRINIIGIHRDGSRGKNFIEWLFDSTLNNKDVTLFNDVYINPLSAETLADFISRLIDCSKLPRIMHLGSSDALSKADIGQLVINHQQSYTGAVKVMSVDDFSEVERPKNMTLNTAFTSKVTGLTMPDLKSEIGIILQSH